METCGETALRGFLDEINEQLELLTIFNADTNFVMSELRSMRTDWVGFMPHGGYLVHRLVDNPQGRQDLINGLKEIKALAESYETHQDWCHDCEEYIEDCSCKEEDDWCISCGEDIEDCLCDDEDDDE